MEEINVLSTMVNQSQEKVLCEVIGRFLGREAMPQDFKNVVRVYHKTILDGYDLLYKGKTLGTIRYKFNYSVASNYTYRFECSFIPVVYGKN
jgi:hypothetical protein